MLPSVVQLYVLLFFMTKIMHCQSLCSCDIPDSDFASGIYLTYYKCNNETPDTIAYPITTPEKLLNVLEDERTIFYVFGYLQFPENPNVQLMMKALCYGRTDNIVLLDWSKYSNGTYPIVFQRAEKVGSLFAQSIRLLVEKGLNVSKIYIVAHSLGTHIAGFAGKCNSFKVPRITALDPANPIIYPIGCYLKSDDAMWIDVIHTDMGGYGIPWTMGTADYVVNHGIRPQPGCELVGLPLSPTDVCSHQTSVEIYAESKYNSSTFDVKKCSFVQYIFFTDCTEPIGIGYTAANISGTVYVSYVPINNKYWTAISPYSTYY